MFFHFFEFPTILLRCTNPQKARETLKSEDKNVQNQVFLSKLCSKFLLILSVPTFQEPNQDYVLLSFNICIHMKYTNLNGWPQKYVDFYSLISLNQKFVNFAYFVARQRLRKKEPKDLEDY